ALVGVDAELRDYLRPGWIVGIDLAAGRASGAAASGGLSYPYAFSAFVAGVRIGAELLHGDVRPHLGARLALVAFERRFDEPLLEDQSLLTTAPGLVAGVTWNLSESLSLDLRVRPSWLIYAADE